jgi:hypothetical protein
VFDVDWMGLLTREALRERTAALVAEACAWAVGLSDGLLPVDEEDVRIDLADAVPGSFREALGARGPDGAANADRFDDEVLVPFALETCLVAADRARRDRPGDWAELADDVGEDPADASAVVRAGGWEAPLRTEAEILVLAALGDLPLLEVETEGLPLSLVRAAEALTRAAAPVPTPTPDEADLAGVLYLATIAIQAAQLPEPVPPAAAPALLSALRDEGLEDEEVLAALPRLPVPSETAARLGALLRSDA